MRLENICITALLLVSSTLSYAQKNREKTDVNVPAIASADSVKMPVDSVLTAQDSSNLAKLNQSLKPVKKTRLEHLAPRSKKSYVDGARLAGSRPNIQS